MYCSKVLTEWAPNIHFLGMFTMVYTIVYRKKALIPIYVYVLINGFFAGFALWWVPYLYIWTLLWGATMLLPRNLSGKKAYIIYPAVCGLHGLLFGTLYAPAQAIFFGLDLRQTIVWIAAGLPWDAIHGAGNFAAGFLIVPVSKVLRRLENKRRNISNNTAV